MSTEGVTWSDRALDTETWVLAAKSAIFIVFSSRQGKNFLSNCPLLHPTAIYYNHDKWTVANILQFSLQTAKINAVNLYQQTWEQLKSQDTATQLKYPLRMPEGL